MLWVLQLHGQLTKLLWGSDHFYSYYLWKEDGTNRSQLGSLWVHKKEFECVIMSLHTNIMALSFCFYFSEPSERLCFGTLLRPCYDNFIIS
ncbi:unnamed protein product [Camellia sinensis]